MKLLNCLEIKNETSTSADLYFYGDIVSDQFMQWQDEDQYPDAIKNFLTAAAGKSLNVYINSGGGSVFAGIAIYNMIHRFAENAAVQVYVDGLAGSIASVIAFSGSTPPKIPSNAFLMIHNPYAAIEGNAADLRKMADELDAITDGIASIYMEHVKEGVEEKTVRALMDAETWLSGKDAAEYFDIETTDTVSDIAAASGEYVARSKHMPKDLTVMEPQGAAGEPPKGAAGGAAENESDNQDARADLIQNKRDEIARVIIDTI